MAMLTLQIKPIRLVESFRSSKFGCWVSAAIMDCNYVLLFVNDKELIFLQH